MIYLVCGILIGPQGLGFMAFAMMSLVVAQYPGLHVQAAETVHLDLDTLDALALRQLASFTAACAKAAQQAEAAGTDGQPDAGPCVEWPGLLVGAGKLSCPSLC